jgi:hypothetical protein
VLIGWVTMESVKVSLLDVPANDNVSVPAVYVGKAIVNICRGSSHSKPRREKRFEEFCRRAARCG